MYALLFRDKIFDVCQFKQNIFMYFFSVFIDFLKNILYILNLALTTNSKKATY